MVYTTFATVGLESNTQESSPIGSPSPESDISQSECDIDSSSEEHHSCTNARFHMIALPSLWAMTGDSAVSPSVFV